MKKYGKMIWAIATILCLLVVLFVAVACENNSTETADTPEETTDQTTTDTSTTDTTVQTTTDTTTTDTTTTDTTTTDTMDQTTTDGQVNFRIDLADGYEVKNIEITGKYKNLKTPTDTKEENVYRITKIEEALTVTITTKATEEEEDTSNGYSVTFAEGEHYTVYVYNTQDYEGDGTETTVAYSRNADDGFITKTDGQVNFKIVCDEGYEVDEVTVNETDSYKNLKDPTDLGVDNMYRITKIKGDLTVTITVKAK